MGWSCNACGNWITEGSCGCYKPSTDPRDATIDRLHNEIEEIRTKLAASEQECERLMVDLKEALDEWGYSSGYKGEYLQEKHNDLEAIREIRERHFGSAARAGDEALLLHSNEVGDTIGTVVFPREQG